MNDFTCFCLCCCCLQTLSKSFASFSHVVAKLLWNFEDFFVNVDNVAPKLPKYETENTKQVMKE